jgi:hypothetical protein
MFQRVEQRHYVGVLQIHTQATKEDHFERPFRKVLSTVAFEYLNIEQVSHPLPGSLHHQRTAFYPEDSFIALGEDLYPSPRSTTNVKHSP